ncbi:hypothetical protein IFM89_034200 [Coptis chinensis]|uniref:Uncharacterized protein n=1 Tax=Coptis chinensis TaxID=261450 RepID=A0A835LFC5_9MAGN|nr:hypothetical protein IFM89_034200 [Coptis chinensis]
MEGRGGDRGIGKRLAVMKYKRQRKRGVKKSVIEMLSESIDETLDKDEAEEIEELTNQLSSTLKGWISFKKVENVVTARSNSIDVEDLGKWLVSLCRI